MYKRTVLFGVARLLQVMGMAMLIPACIAWFNTDETSLVALILSPEIMGFLIAIPLSLAIGTAATFALRSTRHVQTVREGFAIVGLGWTVLAGFGAIPFFVYFLMQDGSFTLPAFATALTDSVFEIMSGFTTTGSTILQNIEATPRGLLFWRALTHWLGGMGIVTLALVIFPAMGVSGYHMFKGEVPGPSKERMQPRLTGTASILWGVYALLTLVEMLLLMLGGMDWFDATCHSFATMATGGFSTKNLSIGYYANDYFYWVIIVFMFLAGMNFLLHYNALRGKLKLHASDGEFRFYAGVVVVAILVATVVLSVEGMAPLSEARSHFRSNPTSEAAFAEHVAQQGELTSTLYGSFREASFQVVSIVTTTGFCTSDFDVWPSTVRLLLLLLMFIGGCAGSTGGGIKMIRVLVVIKAGWREIIRLARPRIVRPIKIGTDTMEESRVSNIMAFFTLFLLLTVAASLLLSLFIPDPVTAFTAVVACIANVGPGLAGVGATENYGWIPIPGKWVLIFAMLLGRLEIFTILVLLRPSVWR